MWHRLKANLLASSKICVDETPAPVLDPGRGRTKTGYFWAIARDDRPWAGPDPPGVAYTYAPGRGAVHGLRLLEGYRGIMQCDGYEAYKTMVDPSDACGRADRITLAFCWSHLRRQFVEIERERGAGSDRERGAASASPSSMRSSAASAADPPMSAAPAGRRMPSRWSWR